GACSRFGSGSLLPSPSPPGGSRREQAPSPYARANSRTPRRASPPWSGLPFRRDRSASDDARSRLDPALAFRQGLGQSGGAPPHSKAGRDRKSTRLNSSHRTISYAVFCLKKKKKNKS